MMRYFPGWLIGVTLLVVSVTGTILVMHSRAGDNPAKNGGGNPPPAAPNGEGVICAGNVDLANGIRSLYPVQPGRVTKVLVHEDDAVKAGDVLFQLDDRRAKFLLAQAEADLRVAQAQLADAQKFPQQHRIAIAEQKQAIVGKGKEISAARQIVVHKLEMVKNKVVPAVEANAAEELLAAQEAGLAIERGKLEALELIDPTSKIRLALAVVDAKQAQVDEAKYAVQECSLRAPTAGKVLRLFVGEGDVLSSQPKHPAIEFCPDGPRIVRAEIEQEFASRVTKGQVAEVEDDSRTPVKWRGKVTHISDWYTQKRSILQEPLQFNDVRTIECIIQFDPGQELPRIGQRVRVIIGQPSGNR